MTPIVRRLIIVWLVACLPVCAFAQVAPGIATGTAGEEVIKVYGWPNGKSMAANREVWIYDEFQVALKDDRVVNVWPITPDKRQPKRQRSGPVEVRNALAGALRSSTATNTPQTVRSSAPTQQTVRSSTPMKMVSASPARAEREPLAARQPVRNAVRKRGVPLVDLWPVLAIGCVVLIGGITEAFLSPRVAIPGTR